MTPCPSDDELALLLDGVLSEEDAGRLRAHVAGCQRCHGAEAALRGLLADVGAAPPRATPLDASTHARAVMARLDRGVLPSRARRSTRAWLYAGVGAAAACVLASALYLGRPPAPASPTWQARGGVAPATLGRDVGVQPYAAGDGLRPLVAGATVRRDTPLTAGVRNLGRDTAFLLLFAVDARNAVHWISPPYLRPGDDPASTPIPAAPGETLLATTAVLDDVPAGPLRVVAVITSVPAHVSDVEALEARHAVDGAHLLARLRGAEVRETLVEVDDAPRGTP